jgi:hypothetical protein
MDPAWPLRGVPGLVGVSRSVLATPMAILNIPRGAMGLLRNPPLGAGLGYGCRPPARTCMGAGATSLASTGAAWANPTPVTTVQASNRFQNTQTGTVGVAGRGAKQHLYRARR